jgi:hypothetical protein
MGKQITYRNDLRAQFCQIELEDGKRILISVAEGYVKIFTLKFFGAIPGKTIYAGKVMDLFYSDYYNKVIEQLNQETSEAPKYGFNQLDVFRKVLLPCKSLEEVGHTLEKFR